MNGIYKLRNGLRAIMAEVFCIIIIASSQALSGQSINAQFNQDKTKGCLPLIVQYGNLSTGNGLSYFWDFGNGNTSSLENPGAIYTAAGNYTVKLVVTDINGNKDTLIKQNLINAFANPVAAFAADKVGICTGQEVAFADASAIASAPIVGWQWNFGDGASTTTQAPKHTFVSDGVYSVSMIVTDSNGCKDFVNKASYIKATQPAKVAFEADNRGGCTLPLAVKFSDRSQLQQGLTYTYKWEFGNGDSSTVANPSFTYGQMGNYNVSLTVTDDNNCAQKLTQTNFISLGKTTANFTIDNKKGCAPHTVNFTNTGTGIPSNATVVWYFGNGDSAIGKNAAYQYSSIGSYSVTMKVSSPNGCNDILVKTDSILVIPASAALFAHNNPISCTIPYTINFSSVNGNAKSWFWDFGDGKTSILEKPVKVYDSAGVFTVKLTITDDNGCSNTFTKNNLVKVKTLNASFVPSVNFGCTPLTVDLTNNSTAYSGIKSYSWDFGNGNTSSSKNSNAVYGQAGTYYPTLIIADNQGCTDTMVYDSIMVGVKTHPDFVADKRQGCKLDMRNVKFTNLTDAKNQRVDGYFWDFGGFTSTNVNPVVDYYIYPDQYTVRLISVSNGCADTVVKTNYIDIFFPHAAGTVTEDPCKLDTIHVKDFSKGAHKLMWELDGVAINSSRNFDMFLNPGNYELDLHVQDTVSGCKDNKSFILNIREPLAPGFTASADSICANTQLLLTDTTKGSVTSAWKVGSQSVIINKNITPTFSNPGLQSVSLTVTDIYGCKETITKTNSIKVLGPDYTPIITPDKGCFPLDAQLIKTGHSVHGVASAVWYTDKSSVASLNDTIPFLFNIQSQGMNTNGITVYLAVTDTLGCKVSRASNVKMSKPLAQVLFNTDLKCDRTVVEYGHNAAASMHIGVLDYKWTMNDSLQFSSRNFSSTFYKNATNKLKLVITETAFGCIDSTEVNIPVSLKKIQAGFMVDKSQTTCPPLVSNFTDASVTENTSVVSAKWWFGDGASSVLPTPSKTYFYPGQYDITYKVSDAQGCSDSIVIKNKINVGGPTGTYFIDKYKGCVPFDAHFSATSQNAQTVKWDLGNGKLSTGATALGTYVLPGSYQPAMVLEDASGCLVVYPVKDPIVGFATPSPAFEFTGKCANDVFVFTNRTDTTALPTSFEWIFNKNDIHNGYNAQRQFGNAGTFTVILKATAANGCEATKQTAVEIKTLKADFTADRNQSCLFVDINLKDNTQADAGIKQRRWTMGDGNTDTAKNVVFHYTMPGQYNVSLVVIDNNGCTDSAISANGIVVFDTVTPQSPYIHRVTVQQNNTVKLEFAPYTKNDFGGYQIFRCISGTGLQYYTTITNPLDTVFTDANVNTFENSYTYKVFTQTACGKLSSVLGSIGHTSVLLQTVADTNVVTVRWNAYSGWEAIRDYQIFRKEENETKYTLLESVPPFMTSYEDEKVYCGNTYHYIVYAQKFTGELLSSSNYTSSTPVYKAEVFPARIVRATVEDDKNILVEFAPFYKQNTPVDFYTIEKSVDGINYQPVFNTTIGTWQYTDADVDVHRQSYYYRARTTDICKEVSATGNIGKTIVLHARADEEDNVKVTWSQYEKWGEGIQRYEIEQSNAAGLFVNVGTNDTTNTEFIDASNLFNQLPKVRYRVKAISNDGVESYSNIDDAKGRSSLFVPNAFTPNGDGHNNKFVVVGAYIQKYEINIYDRYGEKLFTGYSLDESWDGMYRGEPAQDGAYVYVITSLGMDTKRHNVSGTVTLLR